MSPWCPEAKSDSVQGHLSSRTLPTMTTIVSECLRLVQVLKARASISRGQDKCSPPLLRLKTGQFLEENRDAVTTDGACKGDFFLLMGLKGHTPPSPVWHQDRVHLGSCWTLCRPGNGSSTGSGSTQAQNRC